MDGLTHWGRVTQICVGKLTNIDSDNGLAPSRRQAIIWTNAGILLIGPLGTNFSELIIVIHSFSFNKMLLKMSSAIWRPFWLGLNVLMIPFLHYINANCEFISAFLISYIRYFIRIIVSDMIYEHPNVLPQCFYLIIAVCKSWVSVGFRLDLFNDDTSFRIC